MITKKIICGYTSAFGRPIDNGYVANTAAAKPRGIITEVTFLSSLEKPLTKTDFVIIILPM